MITITVPKWFAIAACVYLLIMSYPTLFEGIRMFITDIRNIFS